MKVKITRDSGWSDCEDCGSYNFEHVIVEQDGEVVLDYYGDSHLAEGVWHDWTEAVENILTAIGINVEIQE